MFILQRPEINVRSFAKYLYKLGDFRIYCKTETRNTLPKKNNIKV